MNMLRLTSTASAAALLLACAGSKGEPPASAAADNNDVTETAPVENTPVVDEPVTSEPGADPIENSDGKDDAEAMEGPTPEGDWVSASCGERTYERRISFYNDRRTFEGQDLVSPCPEGTQCVWSGIVNFNGRWWPTDTGVGLDELKRDGDQGVARPNGLSWVDGKLVEAEDCVYEVAAAP
jgi:hypothetical protein